MPRLYLVDERVANSHLIVESIPKGDLGLRIDPYLSVTDIVGKVVEAITDADRDEHSLRRSTLDEPKSFLITQLRIMAYGSGDELCLGWGIHARNAGQLAPLAPYLRTGSSGRCMLFGCNVAMNMQRAERFLGGSAVGQRFGSPYFGRMPEDIGVSQVPGYALLHAFARALGVPATAALDSQTASYDWQTKGVTLTVDPFGKATFTGMDTPPNL